MLSFWLRNRTRKRGPKVRTCRLPASCFCPRLEALDGRIVPSQVNLTVTSLADSGAGSLRAAILAADAGSHSDQFTIDFAVTGTIDLQSMLPDLNNDIAIHGPGASSLTVERAAGYSFSSAVVAVDAGQAASISGLTIANGNAGGIFNGGTLTVGGSTLSGNSSLFAGGIYNNYTGTLTVTATTISGNFAEFGGGIYNNGGMVTLNRSILSNNFASSGGGIANSGGKLTVSQCAFSGNAAVYFGGGLDNANVGMVTVSGSTLSGNSASYGGGIANEQASTVTVSGSILTGNSATYGGGVYNDDHFNPYISASVRLRDSVLTGNSATEGGGIYNTAGATLDVRASTLSGNFASNSGGAIYNLATAMFQQCALSGNTAGSDGGGIFNAASASLSVKDSIVLDNSALLGADLFNDHGSVVVDDSAIGDWFNS